MELLLNWTLWILLLLTVALSCGFIVSMVILNIFGSPYVPSSSSRVATMLKCLEKDTHKKMVDIGSGDGKILVALAEKGIQIDGYEFNPFLVVQSKLRIKKAGVEKYAHVYWKNFWNVDLSAYEVVLIYALPEVMKKLEGKVFKELKKGSKVIVNRFSFPKWKPKQVIDNIYVYVKV